MMTLDVIQINFHRTLFFVKKSIIKEALSTVQ